MIVRVITGRLRSSASFAVSACVHGGILGWVALGPGLPPERPLSIYDQEIRPSEKKIVWYNLREKLPEVAPADAPADPRPPRARVQFDQTLVSGTRDDNRPPQMIFLPDPEIDPPPDLPKPARLPNVVAVAPVPKPLRRFVPPPVEPRPDKPAPALPEAPRPAAAGHSPTDQAKLPFAVPALRPQPRAFTPPTEAKVQPAPVSLPDAPRVVGSAEAPQLPLPAAGPKPQPLPFAAPPEVRLQRQAALLLPDAPAFSASIEIKGGLPIAAPMPRPQPMAFTPPSHPQPASAAAAPATLAEAPAAAAQATAHTTAQATLAIVGLNPANTTSIPAPPGPREAGFSAGPLVRPEGGSGGASDARIAVPGLLVRGSVKDDQPSLVANFSPTSRENLLAAARIAMGPPPPPATLPRTLAGEPRAARVAGAPGARLNGRLVYTVAIQMPNVTSYSGSWIVWFALKEPGAAGAVDPTLADVRPPVPLRKVDPKYIRSAVDDRVEGKVLLSAVIRADGLVESVGVISGLDRRLDSSAAEALAKWVFEPATRNGSPVIVDAVFEIPFHLAPKPAK
jgi:TonB family protein